MILVKISILLSFAFINLLLGVSLDNSVGLIDLKVGDKLFLFWLICYLLFAYWLIKYLPLMVLRYSLGEETLGRVNLSVIFSFIFDISYKISSLVFKLWGALVLQIQEKLEWSMEGSRYCIRLMLQIYIL